MSCFFYEWTLVLWINSVLSINISYDFMLLIPMHRHDVSTPMSSGPNCPVGYAFMSPFAYINISYDFVLLQPNSTNSHVPHDVSTSMNSGPICPVSCTFMYYLNYISRCHIICIGRFLKVPIQHNVSKIMHFVG